MAPSPAYKNLFISYARADDEPFVKKLYQHLTENELQVWWDRQDMPNRALTFLQEIRDAVNNADRLLLVFGPGAIDSDYVRAEWEYALSICKPVLTVLRTGDYPQIPDQLKHQDIPDFRNDNDFDTKFQYLLRQLQDQPAPLGTLYTLPALPQPYIPRNAYLIELIQRVCADLHQPTVITSKHHMNIVIGMGGIGKTTLANALARDCTVRRAFPDGVFWLEIGQSPSITTRMGDIGVAFGDTWSEYPDEKRACSRLSALMEHKQALIILDDVWEHGHVEPFRRVIGNRCRLLVTTRQTKLATIFSTQPLEITTLNEEEGLTLISDRLARQSDTPNPYEQTERAIVRLLGGHTLSISLAAALLAEQGANYAPRLLTRLEQKGVFHDLKLDDNDKNFNLELSLSLSYADLDSDDQRRFRLLGIFVAESSFDIPAVAAVWSEQDMDTTEDALTRLHRKGLIRRENNDRFSLHMLLRAYARALMNPEEIETAHKYVFDYYFSCYGDHDRNNYEAKHPTITLDFANIFLSLQWGLKQQTKTACNFVYSLNYYMQLYRPHSERQEIINISLEAAISVGYLDGQAKLLRILGQLNLEQNNYSNARNYLQQALSLYQSISNVQGEANTLHSLGNLEIRMNNVNAREYFQRAFLLYETIEDLLGQANTTHSLGDLEILEGNNSHARNYLQQAYKLFSRIKNSLGQANVLHSLGNLDFREGHFLSARTNYLDALERYKKIPNHVGIMNIYIGLARLERQQANFEEACRFFEQFFIVADSISSYREHPTTLRLKQEYLDCCGQS